MNNNLLPPSAPGFMRHAAAVGERITGIKVDLRKLWNPDECPVELLPYLAWALSVDRWDRNWAEQIKRQVIKAAWEVHRQKGTIAALERVIEPFGELVEVVEWWQEDATPGTFRLVIGITEQGITEETYNELERLIADAKPCSRHLTGLTLSMSVKGQIPTAAACYLGDELTVYPYTPEEIEVTVTAFSAGAVHLIDEMRVGG